jgi:hypothetical protein
MLCYTYIYDDFCNTIYKLNVNHIWPQDQPSKENTWTWKERKMENKCCEVLGCSYCLVFLIEHYKLPTTPMSPGFKQPQSKSVAFYLYYWCVCKKWNIVMTESSTMSWVEHVALIGEDRNTYMILVGSLGEKIKLITLSRGCDGNSFNGS